jgi:thioredoxin reductase (NADPH)
MPIDGEYELLVVGAGLAGLTAAMYGARFGLRTAIVEHMASGGQVLNVEKIENFPGFPQGVAGFDLGPMVQEQAEAAGASFVLDTATSLEVSSDGLMLLGEAGSYRTRSLIIATGSTLRTLGIPGEEEFRGKGVSQCASCDAPFFVGKDVCVVGGGDSALDEAAVLAAADVAHVTVVHRGSGFARAQLAAIARLSTFPNVETLFDTELTAIRGADTVTSVDLRSDGSSFVRDVAGVFVFVGLEPNSAFLRGVLDLDPSGHIVVDAQLRTSLPNVYAAGDIRQHSAVQLVSAAGDGATAATFAARALRSR